MDVSVTCALLCFAFLAFPKSSYRAMVFPRAMVKSLSELQQVTQAFRASISSSVLWA